MAALALFLLRNVMALLILSVGLRTTPAALRATWRERGLVLRALLVLEIGAPLLALAAVELLPLGYEAAGVLALMAACPGAPVVLKRVRDRAVVLVVIGLVSLLAPLSVAAWVAVLSRALPYQLAIRPGALAQITLLKQLVPLCVGLGIAALLPRAASVLGRGLWYLFLAGFALGLALTLYRGAPVLLRVGPWAIVAALVVVLGTAAMGHWAGRPRPEDRQALAFIAVLGNPALAAAVLAESYPGSHAGALLAAYVLARALCLLPYALLVKRRPTPPARGRRAPPPLAATPSPAPGR